MWRIGQATHAGTHGRTTFRVKGITRKMSNTVLDAKGLNCPLPILRARKALQGIEAGGLLDILATDPGSVKDFAAFCRSTGNELVSSSQEGTVFKFTIKRAK